MRFRNVLDGVLGQRSKVTLLRHLIRSPGSFTGRELSRTVGLDHKTCHAALGELAAEGIVDVRRVGKAIVYQLRRGHPIAETILIPAFEGEERLIELFVEEARRKAGEGVEGIVLFGSVARGEEETGSDVDLLFLARDKASRRRIQERLTEAAGELAARYGNVPQILVLDRATFRKRALLGKPPLYAEVLRTGRVMRGGSFAKLLKNGA